LLRAIDPALVDDFRVFTRTFKLLIDNMRDAGITIGEMDNYWPRYVRSYKGLKDLMGTRLGAFEQAWELARGVKRRRTLTPEEKIEIANSVIQGYGPQKPGSYGMPNARSRRIDQISAEMLHLYVDPLESAMRYVDGATYAAERSRFLGKNHQPADLDETIGQVLYDEMQGLPVEAQDELRDLLRVRFTADIVVPGKAIRNFKQLVYLSTLGQFRSTLTQLTDVALTMLQHGTVAGLRGVQIATGLGSRTRKIAMEDIGIHDHGEEFKDVGRLAQATSWVMRKTGFKAIDRFGKESRINGALSAFRGAAADATSKAWKDLYNRYAPVLGDAEFRATMRDLRQGNNTERVRYLLFLDIAQIQPVTLSNMPSRYLAMPNGRILYTLKTFTVMQLDMVRREMIRKIRTPGTRATGVKQLARYAALFGLMDLGVEFLKTWLRGEPIDPDDLPDMSIDSLLALVGLNRYTVEQASVSPTDAALNFIAPPLSWVDAGVQDIMSSKPGIRSIRNIPIVGELMYYWAPFGRGNQLNKEEAKRDYRKKLGELRQEAGRALRRGDTAGARQLLLIYNERRKQGPGDGRKTPLSMESIRQDLDRQTGGD
jgi:hypothetical protein